MRRGARCRTHGLYWLCYASHFRLPALEDSQRLKPNFLIGRSDRSPVWLGYLTLSLRILSILIMDSLRKDLPASSLGSSSWDWYGINIDSNGNISAIVVYVALLLCSSSETLLRSFANPFIYPIALFSTPLWGIAQNSNFPEWPSFSSLITLYVHRTPRSSIM